MPWVVLINGEGTTDVAMEGRWLLYQKCSPGLFGAGKVVSLVTLDLDNLSVDTNYLQTISNISTACLLTFNRKVSVVHLPAFQHYSCSLSVAFQSLMDSLWEGYGVRYDWLVLLMHTHMHASTHACA